MLKETRNNAIIFNFCFFALACSVSLDLLVKGYPEKIFYLVSYVAVTCIILNAYKNPKILVSDKPLMLLCISLIFFSASKLIWAELFKNTDFIDIRDNYHTVGKRFLLAAFVLFYFYQCRSMLNKNVLKVSIAALFIGLIMALWLGYLSRTELEPRVKWSTDAATTGAYLAVFISMISIILIRKCFQSSVLSLLMFLGTFLASMIMVLLTETRAAIFLTPVLYLAFFLAYYRDVNKKIQALFTVIIFTGAATVLYFSWDRISQIQTDIAEYHTNNHTSVGARLSIWKSGWYSSQFNLLGQSTDKRYQKVEEYIRQHERGNLEAMRNVAYHLHNDMLETLSLQGMFGLFSLLCFYLFGLYFSLNRKNAFENSGTLFVICPVIVFGFTDVVLIQSNTALVVATSLALSLPLLKRSY
ncbi:O-antigen ligase family protein [Serratia symbiotica]|uniref:O-antigen ligase family protein n=1 Tax=Serratia symbiotica TaxID=138074 RepID=UPI001DBAD6DD|nr:O-antigen ligase family protein [Serratia symbiotica]NIG87823.1 hypothetical protein [Serratia symbiotica]USS95806.1 O-antigen ligase family protein [Serratia symbiotica]